MVRYFHLINHVYDFTTGNFRSIVKTMAVIFNQDYSVAYIAFSQNHIEDNFDRKIGNKLAKRRVLLGDCYSIQFDKFIVMLKHKLIEYQESTSIENVSDCTEDLSLNLLEVLIHNNLIKSFKDIPVGMIYNTIFNEHLYDRN